MKRGISHAELMANRGWRFKAWLLTALPEDVMETVMTSPTPPTIPDLIRLAREHAQNHAGRCLHCGEPLPIEYSASTPEGKVEQNSQPSTATKKE